MGKSFAHGVCGEFPLQIGSFRFGQFPSMPPPLLGSVGINHGRAIVTVELLAFAAWLVAEPHFHVFARIKERGIFVFHSAFPSFVIWLEVELLKLFIRELFHDS